MLLKKYSKAEQNLKFFVQFKKKMIEGQKNAGFVQLGRRIGVASANSIEFHND